MKEYDIFLKKQPEGNVFLYMLTYYANLSAKNGLLVDAAVYERAIKKLLVANKLLLTSNLKEKAIKKLTVANKLLLSTGLQEKAIKKLSIASGLLLNAGLREEAIKKIAIINKLVLQANVSSTNKRDFEMAQNKLYLTIDPQFVAKKYIEHISPNIISIKASDINLMFSMPLDGVYNNIGVAQYLSDILKYGLEEFSSELHVKVDIAEMLKQDFEQYSECAILTSALNDLLYRDTNFDEASALVLEASASMALKRYRLLRELDDATLTQQYIPSQDIENVDTESDTVSPDSLYIDDMTLEELDYVFLED